MWDTWDTWDTYIYSCCTTGEATGHFSGGLFRSGTLGTAGTPFREQSLLGWYRTARDINLKRCAL
jgi:hypothetical protein